MQNNIRGSATTAATLYPGRTLNQILNRYRPYIMPIEELIAAVPPGSTVLDVGCGGGLFLGLLAAQGRIAEGTGFDVSEEAIASAKRMAERLPTGHDLQFRKLNVSDGWPEGTFDVVSLLDVMHHIPPSAQASLLETAAAKVRSGGIFLYKDMARHPKWMAAANRTHDLIIAREWIHYLPVREAEKILENKGFTRKTFARKSKYWYMHEILVMQKETE